MGTTRGAAAIRAVRPLFRRLVLPRTHAMPIHAYPYPMENDQDAAYPGTATERLKAVVDRVKSLSEAELSGEWTGVRSKLLWCGGLREDMSTSHAFNDDNHCDLTTMREDVSTNSNSDGAVAQISRRNQLGPHIKNASLPEL